MSYPGPGPQPILLIVDGDPVSGSNPLPTTGGGGGGGTVDQGKAGSALQSWYVRDGSGLLATAAKQDTGNTSLSSIDGKLPAALVGGRLDSNIGAWLGSTAPSVGQKTAANSLPVVLASDTGTLTVATNVTAGSTVGETFANCSTAQILLAATAAPKVRKIYNRAGNGRLFIRYGSAPTAEIDCNFAVEPGSSWEMPVLAPGVLEYAGNVYGIIPSGASTAHGLQVT